MKAVGIVIEYNPFTNGHKYHLEKTKEFIVDIIIPAFQTDNLNTDYPFFI